MKFTDGYIWTTCTSWNFIKKSASCSMRDDPYFSCIFLKSSPAFLLLEEIISCNPFDWWHLESPGWELPQNQSEVVVVVAHSWFALLLQGTRFFEWWPVWSWKICIGQKSSTEKVNNFNTKINLCLLSHNKFNNILFFSMNLTKYLWRKIYCILPFSSKFDLIHLKYGALDMRFERINT